MSREVLDDFADELSESSQEDFPKFVEQVLFYGFIEDTDLAELLDIDLNDIDDLLSSAEHLTTKEWKTYRSRILAYVKKERKKYETLYYKLGDTPKA